MATYTLTIKGMHCKSCSALITDALEEKGATVRFEKDKATITADFPKQEAITIITKEGYEAQ